MGSDHPGRLSSKACRVTGRHLVAGKANSAETGLALQGIAPGRPEVSGVEFSPVPVSYRGDGITCFGGVASGETREGYNQAGAIDPTSMPTS